MSDSESSISSISSNASSVSISSERLERFFIGFNDASGRDKGSTIRFKRKHDNSKVYKYYFGRCIDRDPDSSIFALYTFNFKDFEKFIEKHPDIYFGTFKSIYTKFNPNELIEALKSSIGSNEMLKKNYRDWRFGLGNSHKGKYKKVIDKDNGEKRKILIVGEKEKVKNVNDCDCKK